MRIQALRPLPDAHRSLLHRLRAAQMLRMRVRVPVSKCRCDARRRLSSEQTGISGQEDGHRNEGLQRISAEMRHPVRLLHFWKSMRFDLWPSESPEEARQRRLCRKMLMLPPETEYHHVLPGFATLGALGLMLLAFVAWRLGRLGLIAPVLATGLALTIFTAGVLWFRRSYRHAVAGVLILVLLVGLLAAAVHRSGYVASVINAAGPPLSAFADSPSR